MGTYAYYQLTLNINEKDKQNYSSKAVISHLREEYEEAQYALDEEGNTEDEAKWYNFDTDMMAFSKQYPSILFKLTVEPAINDEEDDFFECDYYYQDGVEYSLEDGVMTEIDNISTAIIIGAKTQPTTNVEPMKSEWQIWMEKSRAARNNR
jgi:hypothetical protein